MPTEKKTTRKPYKMPSKAKKALASKTISEREKEGSTRKNTLHKIARTANKTRKTVKKK